MLSLTPYQYSAAASVVLLNEKIILDQGQLSLYEDKEGYLSLSEIRRLRLEGGFESIKGGIAEGYSESAFWAFVSLNRPDQTSGRWAIAVGPAYIDYVDIYLVHQGELIGKVAMGDQQTDTVHDLHHRLHLSGIDLPPGQTDLYIRLKTSSTSLMLMQLIPETRIDQFIDVSVYQEGILIGILLAILVINILNSVWLRNILFLHFVTYEISLIITLLLATGIFGVLFPIFDASEINIFMQYAVVVSGFFAFVFFYGLLSFNTRLRWLVDLMFFVGIAHCVWAFYMTMLGYFTQVMAYMNWFLVIYMLFMVPVLILQWGGVGSEQRIRIAGFLLFGFFIVNNALFVSGELGVTRYTVLIAPVMILSFQLCLHFILVASIRKSEHYLNEAKQKIQTATREADFERQLRQSNEMFMAMFSHEVRTPLAVIDASVQALQRQKRTVDVDHGERSALRYGRIRDAVKRISELIQLSDIFKQADCNNESKLVMDYDLIELIREVIHEFGGRNTGRIHFFHSEDVLELNQGVPRQVMRVIIRNLLDNALKYSPVEMPVDIYVDRGSYVLAFSVRDHGSGLTEHVREHMFQRYFRGSEESNIPGLGLGLYIVKEFVDRFGMEVLVSSGRDGTMFTCSIPLRKTEAWYDQGKSRSST